MVLHAIFLIIPIFPCIATLLCRFLQQKYSGNQGKIKTYVSMGREIYKDFGQISSCRVEEFLKQPKTFHLSQNLDAFHNITLIKTLAINYTKINSNIK